MSLVVGWCSSLEIFMLWTGLVVVLKQQSNWIQCPLVWRLVHYMAGRMCRDCYWPHLGLDAPVCALLAPLPLLFSTSYIDLACPSSSVNTGRLISPLSGKSSCCAEVHTMSGKVPAVSVVGGEWPLQGHLVQEDLRAMLTTFDLGFGIKIWVCPSNKENWLYGIANIYFLLSSVLH